MKRKIQTKRGRFFLCMAIGALLAAILFALFFAIWNDRYAFFGAQGSVTLTLSGQESAREVAERLKEAGVVAFPTLYARSLQEGIEAGGILRAGEYSLEKSLPYRTLTARLLRLGETQTVRITFPEGETAAQMIERLVERGIGTRERYWEVIATYPFEFAFLPEASPDRAVRLEGYLYPDTYDFYQNSTEEAVIAKLLANFERKFDADYRARCEALGYTVDEMVTLASMIQAEGRGVSEYGTISSVFHNRLRNWHQARLESDATVRYGISQTEPLRPVTPEDLKVDNPYNTYTRQGLPPGAICNPSREAIAYALCPRRTPYYYFVAGKDGVARFATTYREHLRNIAAQE